MYVLGGPSSISESVASKAAGSAEVVRLQGADRYATAVAISQSVEGPTSTVYLASGRGYADALSGGALASKMQARVLLSQTSALPDVVAEELASLEPTKVVLLGGKTSLTDNVEKEVKAAAPGAAVSRIAGADRYETSAKVASTGWDTSERAFYDNGLDFPDALAGVPATAKNDAPLLLTKKTCMPATIAAATSCTRPGRW